MNWLTVGVSLACSVVVAFLSPQFAYIVWRTQKRKEMQLSIAERFSKINSNLNVYYNIDASISGTLAERVRAESESIEQDATLALISIFFKRPETIAKLKVFREQMGKGISWTFPQMHQKRLDLLVYLFAEALSLPPHEITHVTDGQV